METLAIVLSTLGTICICTPSLLKGKNMKLILLLVFLANVLVATSYALTGAFNGAASCGIGAVQTIINYFFERKNKPLPKYLIALYAVAFIIANAAVFKQLTDIVAMIASLAFVLAISCKSGKVYRFWTLVNATLWITYDLLTSSFGPLTTHAILLSTILFGMLVHDRKKETI